MPIRQATTTDIPDCARVLAQAFADDPVMCVLWPQPERRHAVLARYFDTSIRYHHIHGGGVSIATDKHGRPVGAADWDPPGMSRQSTLRSLRAAPHLLAALRTGLRTALRVRRELEQHQPRQPHWYLAHVGTVHAARGSGHGSELVRTALVAADRDGYPSYLVCTRAETVPFYQRFGFDVTDEFTLTDEGPVVCGMWRPPAT